MLQTIPRMIRSVFLIDISCHPNWPFSTAHLLVDIWSYVLNPSSPHYLLLFANTHVDSLFKGHGIEQESENLSWIVKRQLLTHHLVGGACGSSFSQACSYLSLIHLGWPLPTIQNVHETILWAHITSTFPPHPIAEWHGVLATFTNTACSHIPWIFLFYFKSCSFSLLWQIHM